MTWEAWTTLAVLFAAYGTLAFTRYSPDLVLSGAVLVLFTAGVLSQADVLACFGNEAVLTVGILFVVAAGLRETRVISHLSQWLLGQPRSVFGAQLRLMVPVATASAFTNNTPLVAAMLPVVKDWSAKNRIAASKLMIPLSFATILGGLTTLLGTSTNLVVNGLIVQARLPGMQLFDLAWVGIPCAIAGIVYLLVVSPWLLPDRRPAISERDDPRQYTVEMQVEPGSGLVGRTVEQAQLRQLPGLFLVEIERDGQLIPAVGPSERLQGNDRLVFAGVIESVADLQKIRGLRPATDQVFKLAAPRTDRCLIEAVVSDTCPLVGRSIREGRFRTNYNAAVIAVARNGERLPGKIGDIVLHAGDTLLVEAHPQFAQRHRNSRDFFLVSAVDDSAPPRHNRAWVALGILALMVGLAGTGVLGIFNAALLAAGLMVVTGCCSSTAARRAIDWQVLIVIAAALALGRAVQVAGLADAIAPGVIGLAGSNPWLALVLVYGVTMVLTEVLTNTAAAALIFPIALATAQSLGANEMPFFIAIAIAASCGFATPIGYQTNLMVYGPGGYRFSDYLKVGGPLNLVIWAVAMAVIPMVWPL